jgi:hypothetical protein
VAQNKQLVEENERLRKIEAAAQRVLDDGGLVDRVVLRQLLAPPTQEEP